MAERAAVNRQAAGSIPALGANFKGEGAMTGVMKIQWVQQCNACKGVGLYVGLGEGRGREDYAGSSVVCSRCRGTGRREQDIEYREFDGLQEPAPDVAHVWAVNPGIMAHPDYVSGGVTLKEWQDNPQSVNRLGAEMRSHTCPAWWYQLADYEKKPQWNECLGAGRFSDCKRFGMKSECWEKFDKENA